MPRFSTQATHRVGVCCLCTSHKLVCYNKTIISWSRWLRGFRRKTWSGWLHAADGGEYRCPQQERVMLVCWLISTCMLTAFQISVIQMTSSPCSVAPLDSRWTLWRLCIYLAPAVRLPWGKDTVPPPWSARCLFLPLVTSLYVSARHSNVCLSKTESAAHLQGLQKDHQW